MAGQLHHAAINAANFDEVVRFFQEVFEMEISRTRGEAPSRQIWFRQGIQINEKPEVQATAGIYDHLGIAVTNREEVLNMVPAYGCQIFPNKSHWFYTPYGFVVELK